MDEDISGPIASTSTSSARRDLFHGFYAPLQQASKALRTLARAAQDDVSFEGAEYPYLDEEHGLAVQWERALADKWAFEKGPSPR